MFKSNLKRILATTKSAFTKLKAYAFVWPELWSLPLAILVWVLSPYLIRLIDPTAATFDSGVLQIFIYAIVGLLLFNGVVFAGIKFNFPVVFNWYKSNAGEAFNSLSNSVKVWVLITLYLGLLLACVLLAHVMLQPIQPPL